MKPLIIPWLGLLLLSCGCSGLREAPARKAFQREMIVPAELAHQHAGFLLMDPISGEVIYGHQADQAFIPASTLKLLTWWAVDRWLGEYTTGLIYARSGDSVIIRGTGAPGLFHPDLQESVADSFLRTAPSLFWVPMHDPVARYGPGWAWEDFPYGFAAERSELPIHGNLTRWYGGDSLRVVPEMFRDSLGKSQSHSSRILRAEHRNLFFPPVDSFQRDSLDVPFLGSEALTAQLLVDTAGNPAQILRNIPPDWAFFPLRGQSVDTLLSRMLQDSDNFLAEHLLLHAGWRAFDTLSFRHTIEQAKDTMFPSGDPQLRWVDGSGLSRYNLLSPRQLGEVLLQIYQTKDSSDWKRLLPAGGRSGTLESLFLAPEPYVYAKSGSMGNTYNLAGYLLTRKGRVLIFVSMNNQFLVPSTTIKRALESTLSSVRDRY
ncbi:D-alanyl-D-alanine carboxypeptidase [Pontibacter sp. G13]|uniref:D-alanyl-D-alanine carboxypeptidase n=1 Tax=Pontibacter sp. G13 TaxID=3074898 RepID=UPI00288C48A4|nr:D-alanyl-D-alanine carboxypeptidase [Pontibacter sp. G13]WNJ17682.1 D-alanyl-D-alanine carboxypeptidase [Pontibacter sp. G13]